MSDITDETHKVFLQNLSESRPFVLFMADQFCQKGYEVVLPPYLVAKTPEERHENSDDGDLKVRHVAAGGEEFMRLEIKSTTRAFTGRGDWPFGDAFIVDSAASYDRKVNEGREPVAYYNVSADYKCFTMVKAGTIKKHGYREERTDHRTGLVRSYLLIPTDQVDNWVEL